MRWWLVFVGWWGRPLNSVGKKNDRAPEHARCIAGLMASQTVETTGKLSDNPERDSIKIHTPLNYNRVERISKLVREFLEFFKYLSAMTYMANAM